MEPNYAAEPIDILAVAAERHHAAQQAWHSAMAAQSSPASAVILAMASAQWSLTASELANAAVVMHQLRMAEGC